MPSDRQRCHCRATDGRTEAGEEAACVLTVAAALVVAPVSPAALVAKPVIDALNALDAPKRPLDPETA